jgi:transcriptional regulator with XRE-family HTH domain
MTRWGMMSRETAGREVRRAVAATGLTRVAFADRAKVDPGTLGDFLDGRRWPQAPTRRKIEKALGWPAGRISDLADAETTVPAAVAIEDLINADPSLHPVAKAHFLNQLELLRLIPPDAQIMILEEQERRRQEALLEERGRRILEALPDPEPPKRPGRKRSSKRNDGREMS